MTPELVVVKLKKLVLGGRDRARHPKRQGQPRSEHNDVYSQHFLALATENALLLWLGSSLRIKRSLGLQRGKNDKIYAIRISKYAFR